MNEQKFTLPLSSLSFCQKSLKGRVKNILRFKKERKTASFAGIAIILLSALICATDITSANNDVRMLTEWAESFCNREGETIKNMSSDKAVSALLYEGFYSDTESAERGWIGWSSPWPMSLYNNIDRYKIIKAQEGEAEILYYAWVSDPHVTVWRQTLKYDNDRRFTITDEKTEFMDNISSGSEFMKAYPGGIKDTPMDYTQNDTGKYINDAVLRGDYFTDYNLFDIEEAMLYFLNIDKASAEIQQNAPYVTVNFKNDNISVKIRMIRPFGTEGIWLPDEIMR